MPRNPLLAAFQRNRLADGDNRALWLIIGLVAAAVVVALLVLSIGGRSDPWRVWPSAFLVAVVVALCIWPDSQQTAPKTFRPRSPASTPGPVRPNTPTSAVTHDSAWTQLSRHATLFFEKRGLHSAASTSAWTPNADHWLHKGPRKYLVHARYWQASMVDEAEVRSFIKTIRQHNANGGVLLCSADVFTPAARAVAKGHSIMLLEPAAWIGASRHAQATRVAQAAASRTGPASVLPAEAATTNAQPIGPTLRPDHEVRARRDFEPTQPLSKAERAQIGKQMQAAQHMNTVSNSKRAPQREFPATELVTPTEFSDLSALLPVAGQTPGRT
ncbi:restriction endonuclease [Ottowia sp.]|uniref:restriction endonuclease n=1 Tax=Ottowia sp. TaxID=1898956 RepID=UPI003A842A5A